MTLKNKPLNFLLKNINKKLMQQRPLSSILREKLFNGLAFSACDPEPCPGKSILVFNILLSKRKE